jgi:hypothetical protein
MPPRVWIWDARADCRFMRRFCEEEGMVEKR